MGEVGSVDRAGLGDPHALDPQYATEGIEMAVIVQDACTTTGDQIVRRWDASRAPQLARGDRIALTVPGRVIEHEQASGGVGSAVGMKLL